MLSVNERVVMRCIFDSNASSITSADVVELPIQLCECLQSRFQKYCLFDVLQIGLRMHFRGLDEYGLDRERLEVFFKAVREIETV